MTNGLVVMTPSSIAYSGTSASVNADGSVTFSACTSLSLNGVFTSDYDNYMIVTRFSNDSSDVNVAIRLRSGGADETGSNYTYQVLVAGSTTVVGARGTTSYMIVGNSSNDQRDGAEMVVYGPALAQPTALRSTSVTGFTNAEIYAHANTHSLSTSYDGFTFFRASALGALSGLLTVFGFNQ